MTRLAALKAAAEKAKKGLRIVEAGEYDVRADTILALVACAEALEEQGTRSLDDPTDWCCCGGSGTYDGSPDSGHDAICRRSRAALAALEGER